MWSVSLILTTKSARLTLKRGDDVVEDEVWKFDEPAPKAEQRDIAECVFHDCYDLLNYSAHGSAQQ
jgi:hypothetical protein